ncbi:UNVERIFIED_CONTAM: Ubiquitin carboxyl-terminal hydrolase MINDY-3 [Sesamum latifolium]|uniref:ubiquitinyl hydrolase 1 n=1 Tax=Sesamum latifolium TaxID=2727402 RepID=A0AAW2VS10_9LAMI
MAYVLKYLLFSPEESSSIAPNMSSSLSIRRVTNNESVAGDIFSFSEGKKSRALVRSMTEILFLCGRNERAVLASLNILDGVSMEHVNGSEDEVIAKVLGGLSVESGSDLQKVLRVDTCTSQSSALQKLEAMLPIFRSRMGALLFLISALLSRGLDNVQEDRDDPSQPLVTAPFGHASQEIVNLLLSGSSVANVFDGKMDLGGGMFVKGISTTVEVGFLTLLESLNFCKVGQYLKCPRWPIWVVGSESHYTVLFALDPKVQEENELENRETQIRRAFDAQDQSGGGGFISVEGFHQVIKETNINLPSEKVAHLCSTGFIVWSEFWQVLLDLDKSLGGLKDSTGLMGKKVFDLYHFNGIAKSVANGSHGFGNENPIQRPRLTKLRVSVPQGGHLRSSWPISQ